MKYYTGYKFVNAERMTYQTSILGYEIHDKLTSLDRNGLLTIDDWYPWDGSSGPCVDFKFTIEASAVHDTLTDYVNMGWLPASVQPLIDQEYYNICVSKAPDGFKKICEFIARVRLIVIRWYQTGKGAKRFHRNVHEA